MLSFFLSFSKELTLDFPKNATKYEFNQSEINYILHLHNDYGNAICNGSIYPVLNRANKWLNWLILLTIFAIEINATFNFQLKFQK